MKLNDLFQQYGENLLIQKENNEALQKKNDVLIKDFIEHFSKTDDELSFILKYKDTHPLLKRFSDDLFLSHHLKFLDYNDVEDDISHPLISIILENYFVLGRHEILFFERLFNLLPKTTIKLDNAEMEVSYMMLNTYEEDYQEDGVLIIKNNDMFNIIYNPDSYYKDENKIIELTGWMKNLFEAIESIKPRFYQYEL